MSISPEDADALRDKIGNPLFALETNLHCLEERIRHHRLDDALEIVAAMKASLEKAKAALP